MQSRTAKPISILDQPASGMALRSPSGHPGRKYATSKYKIVILDDDPTGTQTAKDLPVLTHWSEEAPAG